jgi:hypothetical protein
MLLFNFYWNDCASLIPELTKLSIYAASESVEHNKVTNPTLADFPDLAENTRTLWRDEDEDNEG